MNLEELREHDGDGDFGGIQGYHLAGHGHALDLVEVLVHEAMDEYGHEPPAGGWEIAERWVYKTPVRGEYGPAGWLATYVDAPARGAKAVTAIMMALTTSHWCYNHPDEPWQGGVPATRFIGGEAMVAERLALHATEVDPHMTVSPPYKRAWKSDDAGQVYLCRPCLDDVEERTHAARWEPVSA